MGNKAKREYLNAIRPDYINERLSTISHATIDRLMASQVP